MRVLTGVIGTYEGRNHRLGDVIPYLHAGWRGVIGTTRGVTTDGKDVVNPLCTCGSEGHNRTYEGRNHRWERRDPLFTCGFEEQ